MIEHTEIDGRKATVSYLGDGFVPVDHKEIATMIKVVFEDGESMFLVPARGSAEALVKLRDHDSVMYERPSQGPHHCAECEHFHGRDACARVEPPISPIDCCKLWTPAE
jgi:hypothetical protein